MRDWILKKLEPAIKEVDITELETLKSENEVIVVLYDESHKKEFEFVAR